MEKHFDNMYPEDNGGPGIEKYRVEPIDDYIIAYIESIFDQPITQLLTYGADLKEIAAYIFKPIAICECSYELQCLVFDLFPRWYIAQTPFRGEIYPGAPINWDIWIKYWEHLATFFEGKTH